jgi:hypothetical protein
MTGNREDTARGRVRDLAYFSRLRVESVLAELGTPLIFLASDPENDERKTPEWLYCWRRGGRLAAGKNVPPEMYELDTWVAVHVSDRRLRLILDEHLSLREVFGLSEEGLYLVRGENPLEPIGVAMITARRFPSALLPTEDLSVFGNQPKPGLDLDSDSPVSVFVHIVPTETGPAEASWAASGSIQEALQRFLSWAAHAALGSSMVELAPSSAHRPLEEELDFIPADDWSGIRPMQSASGTLSLTAGSGEVSGPQLDAIRSAFETLSRVSAGESLAVPVSARLPTSDIRLRLALQSVAGAVRELDFGLTVKWRAGDHRGIALLTPSAASEIGQELASTFDLLPNVDPFTAVLAVRLTPTEAAELRHYGEVDPQDGGWQSLANRLKDCVGEDDVLRIDPVLVERVVRYVQEYGSGGYQRRLRHVYRRIYGFGIAFSGLR